MVDAPTPICTRRDRDGSLSFTTKLFQGIGAIPDVVKNWSFNTFVLLDDQELQTGVRQEGIFIAALSFSGKAVSGIGTVVGGLILALIDFPSVAAPSDVPANAILKLGIIVGVMVPLLYVIPIRLLTRYTITRERHNEIVRALAALHKGRSA